jgi:hypothetical protein
MNVDYDQLSKHYRGYRKQDQGIDARIHFHLQNAKFILNAGAGTGSLAGFPFLSIKSGRAVNHFPQY